MQHPWLLPFLHPLGAAAANPAGLQLTFPPPGLNGAGQVHRGQRQQQQHQQQQHQQQQQQQQHQAMAHHAMSMSLQPMLTPSGALLLPALQQNAAAAVAAFAAAAAAAAAQHQGTAVFNMGSPPVLMAPFQQQQQQRNRLKACERENYPNDANRSLGASEKRKHHHDDVDSFKDVKRAKIETRALKAKRPGFSDERFNETEYYFENGLRKVYPYYFTFTTFTKGRWVGERILDVFAREFRAHPVEEYERCIKSGTLTVNYEKVDVDYRLKHNDLLANVVHRHESVVSATEIKIIHLDDDVVAVDKPCSIPVHPCGRYRHNTVAFILAKEHNLRNLRTIHRLDRLTSGLLLFGRTQEKARSMEQQIRTRLVSKEYVCRVEGDFPSEPIVCEEPIEVVSFKIGVCRVSPKGKDCRTEFERMSFNGKTSVVLCRPHTGRMHQIRVHLQYLGFPIVNDPLYNHTVFGPEKGKGGNIGKSDDQLIHDLISIHNAENWLGGEGEDFAPSFFSSSITPDVNAATPASSSDSAGLTCGVSSRSTTPDAGSASNSLAKEETPATPTEASASGNGEANEADAQNSSNDVPEKACDTTPSSSSEKPEEKPEVKSEEIEIPADSTFNAEKVTFDEHCYECKVRFRDPKPKDLMMFLHALRYKGPGWSYETTLPAWAEAEWQSDDY